MRKLIMTIPLILIVSAAFAGKKDHLSKCWENQVKPLQGQYITFNYTNNDHKITHSFEPWQTTLYKSGGTVWCNGTDFLKSDSLALGRTYFSKTQLSKDNLLYQDYGDDKLYEVTNDMFADEPVSEAPYAPALLINYFYTHPADIKKEKNKQYAIYTTTIDKTIVRLFIGKKNNLLEKITTIANHDQYGDVISTISYSDFSSANTLPYAATVFISNINDKVHDTVNLRSVNYVKNTTPLLTMPADYKMKEKAAEKQPEISVEKYNDHIHFIDLKHTNGRSMIVEFDSFLLVAEAPLNSLNGELIIDEAKKIAPGKPIKYFMFSHYHPDYTGGIRAFIHKGATVICTKGDVPFIEYLATAPHTLKPDSLQLQPHPLQIEDAGEHKVVSDGKYEMDIYFIGKKSEHTNDYLISYFPKEKMLFEGDLTGISTTGPIRKAGKRQAGLYHSIKYLNLDVTTIEQSWPIGYSIKSEIPFTDMEESMTIK